MEKIKRRQRLQCFGLTMDIPGEDAASEELYAHFVDISAMIRDAAEARIGRIK